MQGQIFSNAFVRGTFNIIQHLGIEIDEVLNELGLEKNDVQEKTLYSLANNELFWGYLEKYTKVPHSNLLLGRDTPFMYGNIFENLILSSDNFRDGLEKCIKYQRLLHIHLKFEIREEKDLVFFEDAGASFIECRHLYEVLMMFLSQRLQYLTGNTYHAKSICFLHDALYPLKIYKEFFGDIDIRFNQSISTLTFDIEMLNSKPRFAQPLLEKYYVQMADDMLKGVEAKDLLFGIERQIINLIGMESITVDSIARSMGLRTKELKKKLKETRLSFNEILNGVRHRLAVDLLKNSDKSIDEITFEVGFSELSPFYRAFRRWEKVTPVEFRKRHKGKTRQGK